MTKPSTMFPVLMRNLSICLILAISTCAVYWPARHFSFVNYDDEAYVYENKQVARGLTPLTARWAFQTFDVANYHPVTWLSWLVDSSLFHMNPGPYHVENILLHVLSTLLLFHVLRRATDQRWPSAFVAAIFALHPLHVESVAWVSERKDVLSTAFMLLAMSMYLGYAKAEWPARKWAFYLGMIICYTCGLLSKSMIVTFPFLLLLLDYWPLHRLSGHSRAAWIEKIPLFVIAFASCVVTYIAQRNGGAVLGLESVPVSMRVENTAVSYIRYISKSFWPVNLSPYYPYHHDWSAGAIGISMALLVFITFLCIRLARHHPYLPVGWFWFLGTLVPVIGIVQAGDQSIADRYMYVPLIGLSIIVAWTCSELAGTARLVVAIVAVLILFTTAVAARRQLNYWTDTRTLFDHALRTDGENGVAHVQLGYLDAREGNTANAIDHYNQAIQLAPGNYVPEFDLANLLRKEHPDQAADHYRSAARKNPRLARIQNNWANALLDLGKPGEAYDHFKTAVRLDPNYLDAHYSLGQILFSAGFYDPAESEFETVLRIDPNFTGAKRGLQAIKMANPH